MIPVEAHVSMNDVPIVGLQWTDRTWTFSVPVGVFLTLLERLRGAPVRALNCWLLLEALAAVRVNGSWSAKQHIGHLVDLHELDEQRLREFINRAAILSPADPTNLRTEHAGHDKTPTSVILHRFRFRREALVERMESLSTEDVVVVATHPRLGQPFRLIDWVYFIAEHDDHHLAAARHALRLASVSPSTEVALG